MSYARLPAKALSRPVSRGALFFRAVGGVAFESVAIGKDGVVVKEMEYNASKPDEQRLIVKLRQKDKSIIEAVGQIHDWHLKPVAEFSNSNEGSALTLFGELVQEGLSEELLDGGARIINYHPALDNTLVGLRLMQADILIFQPNTTDLFRQQDGTYIMGAGEKIHNKSSVEHNTANFQKMNDWLQKQENVGNTYRSYVVGDLDQKVTFWESGGILRLDGLPYWWMWRDTERYRQDFEVFKAFRTLAIASDLDVNTLDLGEQIEVIKANRIANNYIESGGSPDVLLERMQAYEEGDGDVESLPSFSNAASKKIRELNGINPVIYDALTVFMRYTALFRYFKKSNPAAYQEFLKRLQALEIQPKVETPTVQYGVVH